MLYTLFRHDLLSIFQAVLHGEGMRVPLGLGILQTGWLMCLLLPSQNQEVNCEIWCLSATSQKMVTYVLCCRCSKLNLLVYEPKLSSSEGLFNT